MSPDFWLGLEDRKQLPGLHLKLMFLKNEQCIVAKHLQNGKKAGMPGF